MKNNTTAPKNTHTHSAKEAAIKELMKVDSIDDFLGGDKINARVDLHRRIHKSLKWLGTSTSTDDNKAVSMRMLYTEALLDLFEKYEKGEGKYKADTSQDWVWKWDPE